MEKKDKPKASTESMRKKRGSVRRHVSYGEVLKDTSRIEIRLKTDLTEALKRKALSEEKGVSQVIRELVEEYLKK